MDRELSSPNFDAARARSNSSSRVPDYFFSATSSNHNRYADSIFSNLPPLHPISTTHKVPCNSVPEHAVPSPTTVCNSPQQRHSSCNFPNCCSSRLPRLRFPNTSSRCLSKRRPTNYVRRLYRRRASTCANSDSNFSSDARHSGRWCRCERAWPAPSATATDGSAGNHQPAAARASQEGPGRPRLASQVDKSTSVHRGFRRPHPSLIGKRREFSSDVWAPA